MYNSKIMIEKQLLYILVMLNFNINNQLKYFKIIKIIKVILL